MAAQRQQQQEQRQVQDDDEEMHLRGGGIFHGFVGKSFRCCGGLCNCTVGKHY